jgi:tetratricopeptide (TPR) repeat protein
MPRSIFVGRETEIARLEAFRQQVHSGAGSILLVEGPAGIGKSSLISVLVDSDNDRHSTVVRRATSVITTFCHSQVGPENAYGPFFDLLVQLYPNRSRRWLRTTGRVAGEAGPALLELVPGIGKVLSIGAVAVRGALSYAPEERYNVQTVARMVGQEVLRLLDQWPSILVIEDAHLLDASSCAVLRCLYQTMSERRLGVVLACRSEELPRNEAALDLIDRLYSNGALDRLVLDGLPVSAIAEYVRLRTGRRPSPRYVEELAQRSGGHPLSLDYYFSDSSPSSLPTEGPLLTRAESVIRSRLRCLDPDDYLILKVAAIQGERFLSSVVRDVLARPDDDVLGRLHRIAEVTGLIRELDPLPWIEAVDSDWYAFHHELLKDVLRKDQSGQERRNRHRAVASALERLVALVPSAPRDVLLEIVSQHHLGGNRMEAAQQALTIARRLAAEGSSPTEVGAVCRQAIDDVRRVGVSGSADRVRAELIELFLTASELRWRGRAGSKESAELEELSDEALAAAKRTGDVSLQSRMTYLRGKVFLHTRGVPQALDLLREARELALTTRDPFSIFITSAEYGRQLPKVDVEAGIAVLREAEELVRSQPGLQQSNDPVIRRGRDLTSLQLGVNLLDAGNLGEAIERLRPAVERIRPDGGFGLLPIGLNYLGQALFAVGQYDEAERIFREAVDLIEQDEGAGEGWHANNLAHLGYLLVYRGDSTGLRMIEDAWRETERTWLVNLVPLVRNLQATAVIRLAETQPELYDDAKQVLLECLRDSRSAGMLRSEVAALSLLARVELAQGRSETALRLSGQAISKLREAGWRLPTICTEEVLYYHGLIQRACGNVEEAQATFLQAWDEVQAKASTLPNQRHRRHFLEEIRLNQHIREAAAS